MRTYHTGKKKLKDIEAHPSTVNVVTANRSQTFCATASLEGLIILWRVEESGDLEKVCKFYDFNCPINDIHMTKDGSNLMAVAGSNGKIIVYNVIKKDILRTMFHPKRYPIERVLLSLYPIASLIFFSSKDNIMYSYSVNGQLLSTYQESSTITTLELGMDGLSSEFVVFANSNGNLLVANAPFFENMKSYNVNKKGGLFSASVLDKGTASIFSDFEGNFSIFINEESIMRDITKNIKKEIIEAE